MSFLQRDWELIRFMFVAWQGFLAGNFHHAACRRKDDVRLKAAEACAEQLRGLREFIDFDPSRLKAWQEAKGK